MDEVWWRQIGRLESVVIKCVVSELVLWYAEGAFVAIHGRVWENGGLEDMPARSESTRAVLAQRRERSWQLHIVHRFTEREVAEVQGIAERTVRRDLAACRAMLRRELRAQQGQAAVAILDHVGEAIAQIDGIVRAAWSDVTALPSGAPGRSRLLGVLLAAVQQRSEVLLDANLIGPAALEGARAAGDFDPSRFTARQMRLLTLLIDRAMLLAQLGASDRQQETLLEAEVERARAMLEGRGGHPELPAPDDGGAALLR